MPVIIGEPQIDGPWVKCKIRVPYADTDRMEHVYYANYLIYFENARSEWMRKLGLTYREFEEMGFGVPVAEAHVRYRGRIFYDDLIEIKAAVTMVGKMRVKFHYEIRQDGDDKLVAEGYTIHAVIDMSRKRPIPVPKTLIDLAEKLEPFEE